ncbi:MAG TPA: hypothetical protein VHY31_11870 [Streptosporangiaceae bacterium]|jgi:hypothetical protein|nr:hypothetical protein [Streptosporangiaceae bacterium]
MAIYYGQVKRAPWKVAVWNRLRQVDSDVRQALSINGWHLATQDGVTSIDAVNQAQPLMVAADAVVQEIYRSIGDAEDCLRPLGPFARLWDLLTGQALMSAYLSLHMAEQKRVLLSSPDQLAAHLPGIRTRVVAYLTPDDPRRVALEGVPDIYTPAHQALVARWADPPPVLTQRGPSQLAAPAPAYPAYQGQGQPPSPVSHPGPGLPPGQVPQQGVARPPGQVPREGSAPGPGAPPQNDIAPHPAPPTAPPAAAPAGPAAPADDSAPGRRAAQLTPMLGQDQRIATAALSAAMAAEDDQQAEVRRFRNVLFGTFASLTVVVAVLVAVGIWRAALIPVCLPKPGARAGTMVCPAGGRIPGAADLPLVLGLGTIGATLAVAKNLAGLKPVGVRYSLSVAQGLVKVALGAITAVLGVLILQTQTSLPGVLGSQQALLAAAVVFGYSQQIFTGLIDRQASSLMDAASPTTPAR